MAGFVWKPTSEKDGNLVVLFPAGSSAPPSVYIVTSDGSIVQGQLEGLTNGGRPTYRFPDNGAAYGQNVGLVGPDGQSYGITNGAQRYDGGNPPAPLQSEDDFANFQSGGTKQLSQSQQNEGGSSTSGSSEQPSSTISTRNRTGDSDEAGIRGRTGGRNDGRRRPDNNLSSEEEAGSTEFEGGSGSEFGNNIGFESNQGFAFPQSDFSSLSFTPITPTFVPPTPVVDPIERTEEVGVFNRLQNQINFDIAKSNALELTQLEFDGLESFNRQARALQQEGIAEENLFNQGEVSLANEFNRSEIPAANLFNQEQIADANAFNQDQRLTQLEKALPGAADTINRQIERGSTLAEGRFVTDAEDRAFEVAARSASADGTIARGFGDDSVFGKRASELLSAEQRLQLSQSGEQTLNRFLTLGANLSFDQPIKQNPVLNQPLEFQPQQARTSQDVRGAPSVPTSTLAVGEKSELNQLSTISPVQAISFDINQNQFQSGVDKFNSTLDFNSQQFNSSTGLKVDLEKLYAETFNSQQEASAINLGIQTGLTQQQFQDQLKAGQQASTNQAIGSVVGAGLTAALGYYFGDDEGGGRRGATGGGAGSNNTAVTSGNGVIVDDFSSSPDVEFDPDSGSNGDVELAGEFEQNEDGSFTFTPSSENEDTGSGVTTSSGLDFRPNSNAGGGDSGDTGSTERAAPNNAATTTTPQQDQQNTQLENSANFGYNTALLINNWDDLDSDQKEIAVAELYDTTTAGQTNAGSYAAFTVGLNDYIEQYDEMSDGERAATELQLYAATVQNPYANTIAQVASIAVNWDEMTDSEKRAAIDKTVGDAVIYGFTGVPGVATAFDAFMDSVFGINLAGLYEDAYGSNKSKDQKLRDAMRDHGENINLFVLPDQEFAEANGVKEGSHQIQLADGSYYDIGVDGTNKLENYGTNIDGKTERNAFDIDWSDPRASEVVGMLNPFAQITYGQYGPKFMGHLVNAATSNNGTLSETKQNVRHFVESTGLTYEVGLSILKNQKERGMLDEESYYAFVNGWNGLMLSDGVQQEVAI